MVQHLKQVSVNGMWVKYIFIINLTNPQILKGLEECARGENHFLAQYSSSTSSFHATIEAPLDIFISTRSIQPKLLSLDECPYGSSLALTQFIPTASLACC